MKSSKYQQAYLLLFNYELGGFIRKHKFQNKVSVLPSANFKQTRKNKYHYHMQPLQIYLNGLFYLLNFQIVFILLSTQMLR
jgi:hypothetical protein